MWPVLLFFLKEFIALYYWYIELFTRKILNIHSWIISCPDGITPNSGLTGPRILYIYIKVKLATIVEGNPKAPFSIATTPMCRGGRYSFPGLLYFTLDPYLIMLSVKQGGIKYHFLESLVWLDLGLNPGLPGHWRTL